MAGRRPDPRGRGVAAEGAAGRGTVGARGAVSGWPGRCVLVLHASESLLTVQKSAALSFHILVLQHLSTSACFM